MTSKREKWAVRLYLLAALLSAAVAVLTYVEDGIQLGVVTATGAVVALTAPAVGTRRRASRPGPEGDIAPPR